MQPDPMTAEHAQPCPCAWCEVENQNKLMKPTIEIRIKPHSFFKFGVWEPCYQTDMPYFMHFSGGCVSISDERLFEFIAVAKLHGYEVEPK